MLSKKFLAYMATGLLLASLPSCGGIKVRRLTSADFSELDGVPFRLLVQKTKVTKYYGENDSLLLELREPVMIPDPNTVYVVEGHRNYGNPFESLEFSASLKDDGTLASVGLKSDPQLDEATKAVAEAFAATDAVVAAVAAKTKRVVVQYE